MSKVTKIFTNKWLSVFKKTMDNGGEYVYSHADWCNSEGVAVLPFREGKYDREFLGRYEICPAHSNDVELCSITGGMDKDGESPVFTARRELIEEGGYEAPVEDFIYLGTVRPSKASDNTTHLFAVNLENAKEVEAVGDGTLGEEGAYCGWIDIRQLTYSKDPLLSVMLLRGLEKNAIQ